MASYEGISAMTVETALRWLSERNGDGMFDRNGVLLAAGETAPFVRRTWNILGSHGLVEFYKPTGRGRGRMRITDAGREIARRGQ